MKDEIKAYVDLAALPDSQRIQVIGKFAMTGQKVAVFVDADPGKAERYIAKIQEHFPKLCIVERFPGIAPGTVGIKVGLKPDCD